MSGSGRGSSGLAVLLAGIAFVCAPAAAVAGDTVSAGAPAGLPGVGAGQRVAIQTVTFPNQRFAPVQLVRGVPQPLPTAIPPGRTQIVSFGGGFVQEVKVIRGAATAPVSLTHRALAAPQRAQTVAFPDPRQPPVIIVRGPTLRDMMSVDLFGPADGGELERIAFAVDGVESRHGSDPGMWRPEPTGPQGPMQVSAAAALDVGGGDRFDPRQNRLLGRAYLAQMFRRYGNWSDALAAYNWGPGNVDQWIAAGRPADHLPAGVSYYIGRVLRDAVVTTARL